MTQPTAANNTIPPQAIALQSGLAYIISAAVGVALKLGLPDLIAAGHSNADALATKSGSNADAVYRVLRALEMAGLTLETAPRNFALTDAGNLLRSDVPGSMRDLIDWVTEPMHFQLYSELLGSVRTGHITFETVKGEPFFQWASDPKNAEIASIFNRAMTSFSEVCIPAFLAAYDFSQFKTLVDVGGGHGAVLRAILKANPATKGVLGEMPAVLPGCNAAIAADGLNGRCNAVACDFFTAVPAGGDGYFMKHILHDWHDDKAITILRNIRKAIMPGGKLILAEAVITPGPAPHPSKLIDLEMLVFVGGKERREDEWRQLLAQGGFNLTRVIETRSPLCLIESLPA